MKKRIQFFLTSLGFFVLGIMLAIGIGASEPNARAAVNYEQLDLFTKVLHYVQQSYVDEVDSKKLIEGAIKGMLGTLDPHTVYLPADQWKEMQVDTSGKFGGLGIEITLTDGFLTVISPIEDTPAFTAGVEAGDRIVMIEDKKKKIKKDTKGVNLQEAVNLMRGEKGSKVTIHVQRKNVEKPVAIEITRDIIKVRSIKGGMIEPDYAWARVTNFQVNTGKDLRKKIEALTKENGRPLKGLVLDLRSNPGGLLEEAVSVSGVFLDKLPIVSTIGRKKNQKEIEYSTGDKPLKDFKLVVLVNESSASASEIVAGALQDHKRGIIVGKQSFGKGSVQTLIELDNKSALKLTVARYYTPSGRSIQSKGITPDIEVDRIDLAAIDKAKKGKYLREADLENHMLGESESKDKDKEKDKEPEVADGKDKAVKKGRIDDPKEMIKTDFQLLQALNYLKAWEIFQAPPTKVAAPEIATGKDAK